MSVTLLFGGRDVTSTLQPNETKFVVDVHKFGDPCFGTYKFLHIINNETKQCVVVGEHDTVENITTVFDNIPTSTQLAPITNLLTSKTNGLELVVQGAITSSKLLTNVKPKHILRCNKPTELPGLLEKTPADFCDFAIVPVASFLVNVQNILHNCHRILVDDGCCVLMVQDTTTNGTSITSLLQENGFVVNYIQRVKSQFDVIVAQKITESNLDTKHNDDDEDVNQITKMLTNLGAKKCPFCPAVVVKDNNCNFVFACGESGEGVFHVGFGCGRAFCWQCGLKFCGLQYDPLTGQKLPTYKSQHDNVCCKQDPRFVQAEYCPGGHSSHCPPRW